MTAAPSRLVALQQSLGNRAVGRLVQARLRTGRSEDQFEAKFSPGIGTGDSSAEGRSLAAVQGTPRASRQPLDSATRPSIDFRFGHVSRVWVPAGADASGVASALEQQTGSQSALALLQGQVRVAPEAEERKADALARGGAAAAPSDVLRSTAAPEGAAPGAGEPLPQGLRAELEASAGERLDHIRVHP
jgi:hypothetical protein